MIEFVQMIDKKYSQLFIRNASNFSEGKGPVYKGIDARRWIDTTRTHTRPAIDVSSVYRFGEP